MIFPVVYLKYAVPLLLLLFLWRTIRRRWRRRPTKAEAVLVTGCDSGFGFAIVKALLEQTDADVFAGCITEDGRGRLAALSSRVTPMIMDVTKDADVASAFDTVSKSGKLLIGAVNNAGLGCYGFCESLSMERYEYNLNVNLLGSIRVTKRALPLLRQSRGRLVTMGSLGCRMPSAFGSGYLPTKAGLGTFQDCVRQEMYRFGVRCSLVEPGFFATGMLHSAAQIGEQASGKPRDNGATDSCLDSPYGTYAEKMKRTENTVRLVERLNGGDQGIHRVTDAVMDALTTVSPQTHYLVGWDANIVGRLGPFVPCWIIDLLQTYVV